MCCICNILIFCNERKANVFYLKIKNNKKYIFLKMQKFKININMRTLILLQFLYIKLNIIS